MFSHLSAWHGKRACMVGGMHVGDAWQRGVHGGGLLYVAGEMATAADGTHPTSMHSCLSNECKNTLTASQAG